MNIFRAIPVFRPAACSATVFIVLAHPVNQRITMEDISWLRLLLKPRADKAIPSAVETKLRTLRLVERDGKQLAVTRKGQLALRLFG